MNPFDLSGPQFLMFYATLGALVVAFTFAARRVLESGPVPKLSEVDPYLVGYLRGGANETLRVAVISLLDRGLLEVEAPKLLHKTGATEQVRRPVERAILGAFTKSSPASSIFSNASARKACEPLAKELEALRLLPGPEQMRTRLLLGLAAVAVLGWIAFEKVSIAQQRGRENIAFLVVLALVLVFVVVRILWSRRTALGDRVLDDMRTLFDGLKDRAHQVRPGGATNELALLVGVFGLSALWGNAYSQASELFPRAADPRKHGNSSGGSGCGSSCGASCGGGGGGGSGGGGSCGGGCGGCGG
ncbi:MAG: hypothetical protein HW416_1353 [Chloroflexi bacterium]|nr:hypothetical protein [Chloroflexota bacterium]